MTAPFLDRADAGRHLAESLRGYRSADAVVFGLPRGGVPVAAEVAGALHAPLDVIVVGKLGLPFEPEVAMGAIGEGGVRVLDLELIRRLGTTDAQVDLVDKRARAVLNTRIAVLEPYRFEEDLTGRVAIVVDDGIATGATLSAACEVLRRKGVRRVVVAAPVGAPEALRRVYGADEIVCLLRPRRFRSVGGYYQDFGQTSDETVTALLRAHHGTTVGEGTGS